MAAVMFAGMIVMVFAFWMYSIAVALARVRAIILERERHAGWVYDGSGVAA
jgi:heme exporter protein C